LGNHKRSPGLERLDGSYSLSRDETSIFAGSLYDLDVDTCAVERPRQLRYFAVSFKHTAGDYNSSEPAASVDDGNSNSTGLNKRRLAHLSPRQHSRRVRGGGI